ncbi:hypothetical protein FA10DRAFT_266033 [Acaromyces ingoldii]|uniref:RING-type domain-containing protein n=1 Tax=Acaromyces ingoldii TaxID=215250 RepID=A0A316YS65_9BASI|nr:hypothetical protein FA10DRAFT_266033 [Acaromyces ingoldii]PWN92237.1 hypothetical protein FA10DRAFT_266033 [Acaromyces ingoldii]
MPRHSKNNTASGHFTKAEFEMLRDVWGSQRARLGAESMRHYDQCALCLHTVEQPVCCSKGHLFCKECILTNLVEQKRDIAALKATLARLDREQEEEKARARQVAIERVQRDFEQIHSGVGRTERGRERGARSSASPPPRTRNRSASPRGDEGEGGLASSLAKRISSQTERAIAAALAEVEAEQLAKRKASIPSYWLPSLTPTSHTDAKQRSKDVVAQAKNIEGTRCFVADKLGHDVSIKNLVDVKFVKAETQAEGEGNPKVVCPSCKKTLGDVTRLVALRRCGHVFCKSCVDTLILPSLKDAKEGRTSCLECNKAVKDGQRDLIDLQREGTGFAAAGTLDTKVKGVSFQG